MALHCFLLQLLFALVVIASFVSDRQMGTHICIRSQVQLGPQLQCSILPVHPSPVTQQDFSHVYIIASTEEYLGYCKDFLIANPCYVDHSISKDCNKKGVNG